MDTDRNLQLGILALQENLVDAEQFALACELWSQRKTTGLGDLFVERGWISNAARARLEYLLASRRYQSAPTQVFQATAADNPNVTLDSVVDAGDDVVLPVAIAAPQSSSRPTESHDSRYITGAIYAEGGIGRIWLARDIQLDREVAIKTLRPELLANQRVRVRFLQEARITGQLEHPGIVPVYELNRAAESGDISYAMRFVRGRTLVEATGDFHAKRRAGAPDPLGLVSLLSAFVAVCQTVAYAHSRGVIHRDLKGDNILLGDFGEVLVLDWGVAKVVGKTEADGNGEQAIDWLAAQPGQTIQGDVVGTPAYMSPEQAEGRIEAIGSRTDLYGLGAILYEILTGRPPFVGSNTIEVLDKVLRGDPTPPRELWPDVPPALEAICLRALSKEPADRQSSASELASIVQTWQEVQRRQAEEALRRQSEILQSILDTMGESLIVIDEERKPLLVNPAAERMLGVRASDPRIDDVLDRHPFLRPDRVTPYPRQELPLFRALRGETVDEEELFLATGDSHAGRWISVNAKPLAGPAGSVRGALMVLRDVTERREAEEQLRRSRERFELAVRGSQDGLWDWDLLTNEVFYSPRWKNMLGYDDHEIRHHIDEWSKLLHPDEKERVLAANYDHINGTTSHYEYEYRLRHKDGSYRWILARGVALRDAAGSAYRMAGSHVDITAWKQLEQELHEAKQRYQTVVESQRANPD